MKEKKRIAVKKGKQWKQSLKEIVTQQVANNNKKVCIVIK